MKPRPIDADKLLDRVLEMLEDKEIDVRAVGKFMDLVNTAPTIAPPPNDPLTLEELREMEGAPIYIEFIHDRSMSCYRIIRSISDIDIDFIEYKYFDHSYSLSLGFYGRDWLAFRSKPEEVQT